MKNARPQAPLAVSAECARREPCASTHTSGESRRTLRVPRNSFRPGPSPRDSPRSPVPAPPWENCAARRKSDLTCHPPGRSLAHAISVASGSTIGYVARVPLNRAVRRPSPRRPLRTSKRGRRCCAEPIPAAIAAGRNTPGGRGQIRVGEVHAVGILLRCGKYDSVPATLSPATRPQPLPRADIRQIEMSVDPGNVLGRSSSGRWTTRATAAPVVISAALRLLLLRFSGRAERD